MQAVFLDRDGVINENRTDHVKRWEEFQFLSDAAEAIARLSRAGIKVFVISNQAVVNRGLVTRETVDAINQRMVEMVGSCGGRIDDVAFCPHRPDERCGCRKPEPGMILDLARRHNVDLRDAVVIGDALSDIEAGQAAGCRSVLVLTGRGCEELALAKSTGKNGFAVAPDLLTATELLLGPATEWSLQAWAQPITEVIPAVA